MINYFNNNIKEIFLTKYFSIINLFTEGVRDRKALFMGLAAAYRMPCGEELDKLFALTESDYVATIRDKSEYERTARVIEYNRSAGGKVELSEGLVQTIKCKGIAYQKLAENDLLKEGKLAPTEGVALGYLSNGILRNNVLAHDLLGTMLVSGGIIRLDEERGIDLLRKSGGWNDIDSLLMLLARDGKSRGNTYLSALDAVVRLRYMQDSFGGIISDYSALYGAPRPSKETLLVAKYVQSDGSAEAELNINPMVSRIVYSETMLYEDKKRVVLSKNTELISAVNELPIECKKHDLIVDACLAEKLPFRRDAEVEAIEQNLCCTDLRHTENYRPLLLVSKDEFVLASYAAALRECFTAEPVKVIEADSLTREETANTRENILISALSDTESLNTVFFIANLEHLNTHLASDLVRWLKPATRRSFKLQGVGVTLDLSNCHFVCFAESDEVDERLSELCTLIELAEVCEKEKPAMVAAVIEEKSELYTGTNPEFGADVCEELAKLESGRVLDIVDAVFQKARASKVRKKDFAVTVGLVRELEKKYPEVTPIGFR